MESPSAIYNLSVRPHIVVALSFLCGVEFSIASAIACFAFTLPLTTWYSCSLVAHAIITIITAIAKSCTLVISEFRILEMMQIGAAIDWLLLALTPAIAFGILESHVPPPIITAVFCHILVAITIWVLVRYRT